MLAMRALQHAQVDWFEPMPFGVRERGVSRDALRDGIVAFSRYQRQGHVPRARAGQTVWIERGQTALVLLCLAGVRRRLRVALQKLGRRNPKRFARATGAWAM